MTDQFSIITTLVTGFGLALVFGWLAERFLKTPTLVGYIIAGVSVGLFPLLPNVDRVVTEQFAEIGVMLLMFGVGLHFSVADLVKVKGVAVTGAMLQMAASGAAGTAVALLAWDWALPNAIVFGMTLSCASTVVVMKALELHKLSVTPSGQVAIGWLVVQDLVTVFIMVCLPLVAQVTQGEGPVDPRLIVISLSKTLLGVAVFVAGMLIVGKRLFPWILQRVALSGSRELFTLCVLAIAIGIAYGAGAIFNVSYALGAFFAGMVMRESKFAHRAATESLPLQDAFSVLFFVGVGMLFDWHIIIEAPLSVLTVLLIIMLGKGLAAFGLVYVLRYPLHTAITVAASLAQIGEFSFILVGQAKGLGLATDYTVNLIVGAAILSIALNPVVFSFIPAIGRELTSRWAWARAAALREAPFERVSNETPAEKLHNQIVITGKSRLLPPLATELHKAGAAVVAIVQDHDLATELDKLDVTVIVGNPADPQAMVAAHLKNAGMLMILDNSTTSLRIAEAARAVKGDTPITIVAPDPGIWTDVPGIDGVRFVSSYESAAEKISVDVNTAFAENAPIGTIINTKLAEATAREEERTENTEDKDRDETAAPEQASVSVPQSETTGVAPAAPSDASIELQASSAPSAEAVESVSLSEGSGAETAVPTEEKAAGETKDRPGIFSFLRRKQ